MKGKQDFLHFVFIIFFFLLSLVKAETWKIKDFWIFPRFKPFSWLSFRHFCLMSLRWREEELMKGQKLDPRRGIFRFETEAFVLVKLQDEAKGWTNLTSFDVFHQESLRESIVKENLEHTHRPQPSTMKRTFSSFVGEKQKSIKEICAQIDFRLIFQHWSD